MKGFNLFRVNCWLDDIDSVNFNTAILSLVCEYLYDKNNAETKRKECFKFVVNELKLKISDDLFNGLIESSGYFDLSPTTNDVLIKLNHAKFAEVDRKVCQESIEVYLKEFIKERGYDPKLEKSLLEILYSSIYENINTFSTENIKSILSNSAEKRYLQVEIDAFNEFLEWENRQKNTSLYFTFLKAIEFAIVTSGRGIKDVSKDIFSNKVYYLDTNIILRMIGVGGEERKDSLINLIESCVHEGIQFNYSYLTQMEFNRIISEKCSQMTRTIEKASLEILEDIISDSTIKLNNSFETNYAELRSKKIVRNVNQYNIKLSTEFQKIRDEFKIVGNSTKGNLKKFEIEKLAKEIHKAKKENYNVRYSMTAARVDAANILYVRQIRGSNNYNYSDIKSFYLTTDRTLNKVLSEKDSKTIPETILPSQLFLLHNSDLKNSEEIDFETFIKFLKRRNTEFKIHGGEILEYIDTVRNYSNDKNSIKAAIKVYSDKKYESPPENLTREAKIVSLNEFSEKHFDKKLQDAEKGSSRYYKALDIAVKKLPKKYSIAIWIANGIEIAFILLIGLLIHFILNSPTIGASIVVILFIANKLISFFLKDRFGFHKLLISKIYWWIVYQSSFLKNFGGKDENYLERAKELEDEK